ncbi:MAG: ABC transporter ATP-binding protein [Candidatus Saccharibacteria bacterium]|nr:ABC transporter ATP-binding protein [Candidatus Saccharibacteria bacterium]
MKKVLRYLAPYWWQCLLTIGFIYIYVWASLQLPTMMSDIVNKGVLGNDLNFIWQHGLLMLGVTAIGGIATIVAELVASRVATGFALRLRAATFNKIESFSLTEINKFSTASLITRSTNDIQQIQNVAFMVLRIGVQAPLMAVGAIFSALHTAPNMAWLMALSVVLLLVMVSAIFFLVIPKFKLQQKLVDQLNLVARENLTGLRVIRAFNNENIEERKFNKVNRSMAKLGMWINRIISIMSPGMTLIISFTMLSVIWVGSHLVVDGNLGIGDMMAFMQYSLQVITSFLMLVMTMVMLPRAQVSAGRVNEVLATENSIKEPTNPEHFDDDKHGILEFNHVTFSYPGAESPVLNDINFIAEPGKVTAFIGSTGSGKSTLVNLIPRLYDVSSGQILINGHDIRKIARRDLVKIIGFVPQKGVLFSGTVESNIKYADSNISDEEMRRAADIAQADFIKDLDGNYNAHIAQGGTNVSGGQKQRLSIARALAKNPEILVFDDSFSALDYKTDSTLRKRLATEEKDKNIIIVAQRISTIRHADQIIVLDDGSMVGKGTHQELLRGCDVYREIASSQFSEEEMKKELQEAGYDK